MENYTMLVNFLANLVLTISFTAFIIFVFGRQNSKLNLLPWYKTITIKIGLSVCAIGSLLNTLTVSNPPWTEVVLNTGLAFVFSWAAYFHYSEFVRLPKSKTKVKRKLKNRA